MAKTMSASSSNQKATGPDTMDPVQREAMEYTKKMRAAGML